jgi:hypothetical protein
LRSVSVLLHAFLPSASARMLSALGREDTAFAAAPFGSAGGGVRLGELGQLFPKIEPPAEDAA